MIHIIPKKGEIMQKTIETIWKSDDTPRNAQLQYFEELADQCYYDLAHQIQSMETQKLLSKYSAIIDDYLKTVEKDAFTRGFAAASQLMIELFADIPSKNKNT